MHRRAHMAKDLRNVTPRFASAARSLIAPVLIVLAASCGAEERSTGPAPVADVPVAAAPDVNARLVLNDEVPDSIKALSRSGDLTASSGGDGALTTAFRGALVLASSLGNLVTGTEPLVTATAIPFAPESGLAANLGPACDDCVMTDVPIGFSFSFFGNRYDKLDISSNGFVRFGAQANRAQSGCCAGSSIPRAENSSLDNMISISWSDWRPIMPLATFDVPSVCALSTASSNVAPASARNCENGAKKSRGSKPIARYTARSSVAIVT